MLGCPRSVEIVDRGSSSQNEVVVRDLVAVVQLDFMTRHIDPCDCRHAKRHVVLMPKKAPHGRTYVLGTSQPDKATAGKYGSRAGRLKSPRQGRGLIARSLPTRQILLRQLQRVVCYS